MAIPVETRPGEVAQVDFGHVGKPFDPVERVMRHHEDVRVVLVLGHSRHMVARLVFDQKVATWLRLHIEAFVEDLGGVQEVVVPDNLKSAVVRAAFGVGGATALNRSYRELARHYGFKVDPAPIYQPKKKEGGGRREVREGELLPRAGRGGRRCPAADGLFASVWGSELSAVRAMRRERRPRRSYARSCTSLYFARVSALATESPESSTTCPLSAGLNVTSPRHSPLTLTTLNVFRSYELEVMRPPGGTS